MIPLSTILLTVCNTLKVPQESILNQKLRLTDATESRQVFCGIAKIDGWNSRKIGSFLNHPVASVNYRIRSCFQKKEIDRSFRKKYDDVLSTFQDVCFCRIEEWVCTACGEPSDPQSPDWKWDGKRWLHQHEAKRKEKINENQT